MAKTIVGVFSDATAANNAVRDLTAAGVPRDHVGITSNGTAPDSEPGFGDRVIKFFESLFVDEGDKGHASTYTDAWKRGQYLVVAEVTPAQVEATVAILNRHGTVDLSRSEQQTSAIPVVQEELAVGKHVVQRGGVRIHSYVEERPVEEAIRLREELLTVDRRPVSRPAERGDATFQERTVDVIAQGEEAVAEKRARVVEEVVVAKDVAEREETVRDTVRRKDVDVEHLDANKAKAAVARPAATQDAPRR
ncbi:MAG: YsnF/AvaK domain-containing protein [Polyangiales bacterium]